MLVELMDWHEHRDCLIGVLLLDVGTQLSLKNRDEKILIFTSQRKKYLLDHIFGVDVGI